VAMKRTIHGAAARAVVLVGLALVVSACGELPGPGSPTPEQGTPVHTGAPTQPSPTANPSATSARAAGPEVTAAATSRGPELEASDPAAARLDSGGLQLVEFFRFT
jgi:hypothetical protein